MIKDHFRRKQPKKEIKRENETKKTKMMTNLITNKTRDILEDLVMYFFSKYLMIEDVEKDLDDISKEIHNDYFLKNDEEFNAILRDIRKVEEEQNIDKYIVFEKLSAYQIKILQKWRG